MILDVYSLNIAIYDHCNTIMCLKSLQIPNYKL